MTQSPEELTIETAMENSRAILCQAMEDMSPDYVVSMVSGGKDSMANHAVCEELGIDIDLVIHVVTGTGIAETRQFVEQYFEGRNSFIEADAGSAYEDYVLRKGFFGKGRDAHNFSFRVLKAGPYRKVISRELRQRRRNVKVMLLNGARASESLNRQKTLQMMRPDPAQPGNVWVNPLHNWTAEERDAYIESRCVPINPVSKALCRSGECMCGTVQSLTERVEAAALYPEWGRWLDDLESEVRARHGYGWGEPFPRQRDPRQGDFFEPMCIDCGESS